MRIRHILDSARKALSFAENQTRWDLDEKSSRDDMSVTATLTSYL